MTDSYPSLVARTRRFSLGRARDFTVSPDGTRVLFLRTAGGEDPVADLWEYETGTGGERAVVRSANLDAVEAAVSDRERARRERARDTSAGIGSYATDAAGRTAVFTVSGRLYAADVATGEVTVLPAREPAAEARVNPGGTTIAYVCEDELRVIGRDGKDDRSLAEPDGPQVAWGVAEHEASESMYRYEGYWWAPDGRSLVAARVDNSPVDVWYVSDPTNPAQPPTALRYPAAGRPNADVSLHILGLDGTRTPVRWDRTEFEYVTQVVWDHAGLLVVVQNRRQTIMRVLAADPATGATTPVTESTDPAWTTIVLGVPARTASGALLWTADEDDTRRLTVDGVPVTPPGLQLDEVLSVDGDTVLFAGREDPTELHLWTWSAAAGLTRVTTEPGEYGGRRAGGTTVVNAHTLTADPVTVFLPDGLPGGLPDGLPRGAASPGGGAASPGGRELRSFAAVSPVQPDVRLHVFGERSLRTAVLFPTGYEPGSGRLPVLMDPYGGSAMNRVIAARYGYWTSQWFADQGFAVVIADGRRTPGRGPRWERAGHGDHAGLRLQDQVDALHAAALAYPDLDLDRVGIRGWSAGGYLAALAVLRRPDVFHAAVAGAPVTDQLLYSSHWQERTLGLPAEHPDRYAQGSLIADAPNLRRPLLLIHGLMDDNVLPVHTMKLSAALLAAGRRHDVLPLPATTHMGAGVENLLEFQLDWLRQNLPPA